MSKLLRAQSTSTGTASFIYSFLTLTMPFTNISKQRLQSAIILFIPEVLRGWLKAEPCCARLCTNKATEAAGAALALLDYCFAEVQFKM